MYQPPAFREDRLEVLHGLIRAHPLATLITAVTGGLIANLVPFTLIDTTIDTNDKGMLRAHIAKANSQIDTLQAGAETLVLFHGPQANITPSLYATSNKIGARARGSGLELRHGTGTREAACYRRPRLGARKSTL